MTFEVLREFCLSLPEATEDVQWGEELLFRIRRKIFAMYSLNPAAEFRLSFKTTPEGCAELLERDGIEPAPYVGRYHWVALRKLNVLSGPELRVRVRQSYELVAAKAR